MKVNNVDDLYITRLRHELTTVPGFSYQGYLAAARYAMQAKRLDDGLKWADAAISMPFIGQTNFDTLSVKAQILAKMGKEQEATNIMQTALKNPTATPAQIHQYGRLLLTEKKTSEAVQVFKYNAERFGDEWPTHVGLMRAALATGDNSTALEQARKAVVQAPDDLNKKNLEDIIKKLSSGQTVEQ
jgi:predicted Zn-dependent protease